MSELNKRTVDRKALVKSRPTIKSCLKSHSTSVESGRASGASTGHVSFAHAASFDGRVLSARHSQNETIEKRSRSAAFAKKAKELQLAELISFKDHVGDRQSTDE